MSEEKIELGDKVKDLTTGFEGVATSRSEFLTGCTRVGVQPPVDKDGKVPDAHWFDEPMLTIVEKEAVKPPEVVKKDPGGPQPNPKRAKDCPS